ncbi:ferredoxin [Oceanisphaera litoralis]|uniref:2Fe-2S iron-sulfur cluster-binding protein n=1 Tax=Oceanisphaera litoralis TaxID=225144 RepID=UPI00195B2AF9|nr:2Fe-2S iron-sulfur cluster-binding protein [Oceanisphaera litoralis]MBM7456764.1 ferredoxin [Oceanisphaera litoralis]
MPLIRLEGSDEQFHCDDQRNLLEGMQRLACKGIPLGCRGGGCGVCRVQVLSGRYHCTRMSREQVSESDEDAGIALACRLYPKTDLAIAVLGRKGLKRSSENNNKR